jgi:ubiquinone/menaquinone biosynthesis C-methylase UbiE
MLPPLRLVSAKDFAAEQQLRNLDAALQLFYNSPDSARYFEHSHAVNETWQPGTFHDALRGLISNSGGSVADVACGSGHAFINLRHRGVHYTGVDWSAETVAKNARNYPTARFVQASFYDTGLPPDSYDVVFSLYALEHAVWPHRMLAEMHRITKPNGATVVLCPNYRVNNRIPSLHFGSVSPLSDKVKAGHFLDAAWHLLLRNAYYPSVIGRHYRSASYPFLINLAPSCLKYEGWYADTDAVYFVDQAEVTAELVALGGIDVSHTIRDRVPASKAQKRNTCFVVVRKHAASRSS